MNNYLFILYFASFICNSLNYSITIENDFVVKNDYPVIGILAQEITNHLSSHYPEYKSYIAASYVKFLEGGGARVVPVWIGQTQEYYQEIMSHLNGILFPGGATYFNNTKGYAESGAIIYKIAMQMNENGKYMPLWGTCLGFELLTYLDLDGIEHRARCSSNNQPLPLDFKNDFQESRLFGNAPSQVIKILSRENVTSNFHQFCTTEKNLTDYGLDKNWRVMSTNKDWNGFEFISTIEHKKYPFYGVQFHPEKNIYEWISNKNITHTANAIIASQYFAQFFVNEARKSYNTFDSIDNAMEHLIYNFPTTYTGLKKSIYEQCYLFESNQTYDIRRNIKPDISDRNYNVLFMESETG